MGFESNLRTNAERKAQKYRDLVLQQSNKYANVKFINLSMSALGIFDKSTSDFDETLPIHQSLKIKSIKPLHLVSML